MTKQDPQPEYTSNVIGPAAGAAAKAARRPQVAYADLREWIELARGLGEVRLARQRFGHLLK